MLGPLEIIYVDDLPQELGSYMNMFADNVELMNEVESIREGNSLQRNLDKKRQCIDKLQMIFNPKNVLDNEK